MKEEQTSRTYYPNPKVLLDLLEVAHRYNLDAAEFEVEIRGILMLLEKTPNLGVFDDLDDVSRSMKTAVNIKFGDI